MKKSEIIVIGIGVVGLGVYFLTRKSKDSSSTIINPLVDTNASNVQLTTLPDGTKTTTPPNGTSVIAEKPVDVVTKLNQNEANLISALTWQVDKSLEAMVLSKHILERVNAQPSYSTMGTHKAVNKDIYDSTQKMFDLGYAPNGKGGIYNIKKIQGNNAEANALSKKVLDNINKIPNYKTKGTLNAINKEIYDWTQKMFALGYVPDLKGGSYVIV